MCLVFLAFQVYDEDPVMLGANREESRRRPSTPPVCCRSGSSRCLLAGADRGPDGTFPEIGTWLGVNETGLVVAVQNEKQRIEERFASGPDDDLARLRLEPSARVVAGNGGPEARAARDWTVGVRAARISKRVAQERVHGKPGLAEGQVDDLLATGSAKTDRLVHRQSRRE